MKTPNTFAKPTALIAGLILGSSAWVHAQTNQIPIGQPGRGPGSPPEMRTAGLSTNNQSSQPTKINKASSLIGTMARNQQGEELGKIRDLAIDFNSGRVAYIVLESDTPRHTGTSGEQLRWAQITTSAPAEVLAARADGTGSLVPLMLYPPGFDLDEFIIYDPAVPHLVSGRNAMSYWTSDSGEPRLASSPKLHAVPILAFRADSTGTSVVLNANKDNLERSEGFAQDNWPSVTTTAWGAEPFWKTPERTFDVQERNNLDQQKIKAQQSRE